jgi:hypothetical protein
MANLAAVAAPPAMRRAGNTHIARRCCVQRPSDRTVIISTISYKACASAHVFRLGPAKRCMESAI